MRRSEKATFWVEVQRPQSQNDLGMLKLQKAGSA
jgi:hypothetical protein